MVLGRLTKLLVTGLVQILHLPVLLDQEVIVMEQFTMTTMLQAITSYGCQELWVVPRKLDLTNWRAELSRLTWKQPY